jgi:hypothetical protein
MTCGCESVKLHAPSGAALVAGYFWRGFKDALSAYLPSISGLYAFPLYRHIY